jgi:hypothetical protein
MNRNKSKNVLKKLKKSTDSKDYIILSNRGKVIKIYKKMRSEKFVHVVREILSGGYKVCVLIENEKKVYIKNLFVQNNIAVITDYKNNIHYFDGQTIKELSKIFEFSKESIKLRIAEYNERQDVLRMGKADYRIEAVIINNRILARTSEMMPQIEGYLFLERVYNRKINIKAIIIKKINANEIIFLEPKRIAVYMKEDESLCLYIQSGNETSLFLPVVSYDYENFVYNIAYLNSEYMSNEFKF